MKPFVQTWKSSKLRTELWKVDLPAGVPINLLQESNVGGSTRKCIGDCPDGLRDIRRRTAFTRKNPSDKFYGTRPHGSFHQPTVHQTRCVLMDRFNQGMREAGDIVAPPQLYGYRIARLRAKNAGTRVQSQIHCFEFDLSLT